MSAQGLSQPVLMAIAQLKIDEGLRLKAYKCSKGFWSLGYGRNLEAIGISKEVASKMTCTKEEAEHWLIQNVLDSEKDAKKVPGYENLNDVRKSVVINMVFNLGLPKLLGFKDFIAALKNGNYEIAATEMMDSKWALDVGDGIGKKMDRAEELYLEMKHGKQHQRTSS